MTIGYLNKFLLLILIIIIIFNFFNCKKKEGFGSSSALPNIISQDNFNQYFMIDKGIANCSNESGCPTDPSEFISGPGIIEWKNGQSLTFRTKNPVLPSGEGFLGFKLNSVPMNSNIWNSIWLMGKNRGHGTCGPCLEIDIYELINKWWKGVPKISFHDWPDGVGADNNSQACFGVYLNGNIGDGTCSNKYGKIIKNWNWNSAQSKIYTGASWFTLVTKDNKGPLVYVGISLNGWLPKNDNEISLDSIKNNSDFLVSSGSGNISGNPVGGFYFCLTSTKSGNEGLQSTKWNIPQIVNYDGISKSSPHPKPSSDPKPSPHPKPSPDPNKNYKPNPSSRSSPSDPSPTSQSNSKKPSSITPATIKPDNTKPDNTKPDNTKPDNTKPDNTKPDNTKPDNTKPDNKKPDNTKPEPHTPIDINSNKNKFCNLKPAELGDCECANPNNSNEKKKCSLQPDGECKIPGNDGWGICDPKCCK